MPLQGNFASFPAPALFLVAAVIIAPKADIIIEDHVIMMEPHSPHRSAVNLFVLGH